MDINQPPPNQPPSNQPNQPLNQPPSNQPPGSNQPLNQPPSNQPPTPTLPHVQPTSSNPTGRAFPHPESAKTSSAKPTSDVTLSNVLAVAQKNDSKKIPMHDSHAKGKHLPKSWEHFKKYLNKQKPVHGVSGYQRFMLTLLNQTRESMQKSGEKSHALQEKIKQRIESE